MSYAPRFLALLGIIALALPGQAATQPEILDLRVEKQPLSVLIERIARQCDAGLVVNHSLQNRMAEEVSINAKDAKWKDATRLLADEYHIAITLVADRLVVSDADEEFRKRLVSVSYDMRALSAPLEGFPGPDLSIPEPGAMGSRLLPPIEPEAKPEVNEFIELVQRQVEPDSWKRIGVNISEYNGAMVITQVPEIQLQIAALITRLERATAREVVCRCYRMAQVPADLGAVIDAKALQALGELPAPAAVFVTLDEQQNHHFSGVQRRIIDDADVNQAVQQPVVTVIADGLVVDIDPHVTIAGVLSTTRLSATVSHRLGSSAIAEANGKEIVMLDIPDHTLDRIRDTRLVSPGGAAIYRFSDRTYLVAFEVLDYLKVK